MDQTEEEEIKKVAFYQRYWFVLGFLVLLPPVGLLLLWLNKRFNLAVKILLTIIFGYWFVTLFGYMTNSATRSQMSAAAARQAVTEQKAASEQKTENTAAANTPEVTLAEYSKIEPGMTYDQIVAIIGGSGTLSYEFEETFDDKICLIQTYSFKGIGDEGANVILSFQDGILSMKTQNGLK